MSLHIEPFNGIPLYDADVQERGWPAEVLRVGEAVRRSDALLIVSPEYNFSVPGGLKNLLDWLSRLPDLPLKGKPVAIFGVVTGVVGTARMQYDLRRILHFMDARVLPKPEVFIGLAHTKFDENGHLVDVPSLEFIRQQMAAFHRWIVRERAATAAENEYAMPNLTVS